MLDHIHLLVQGNMITKLTETDIRTLVVSLIDKIDMKILGGPFIYRSDELDNEGVTAITAITTSHIVIHTWDSGMLQLDVYSCKKFNVEDITDILKNLSIYDIKIKFLDRSNGFTDIS